MNCLAATLNLFAACVLSLPATAQELTVAAAASLQGVMRDIGHAYGVARPGTAVAFTFAASGALLAQVAQGAPVDVFASADQETMDKALAQRLIVAGTRVDFAGNELVLITPASRAASLKSLADLNAPAVQRIALGRPGSVPAGRYARAALEQSGQWAGLAPKFVFAENVRQTLSYVSRAEVDAGFVYLTDALLDQATVRVAFSVPTAAPVQYPIARVAASRNVQAATDFIAFVQGPQAAALLAKHGFRRP